MIKLTIWRILAAMAILALLAVTWYMFMLNKNISANNVRLTEQKRYIERELEELYKQKKALEIEFDNAKKEKEDLIDKIGDYETMVERMKSESESRARGQEAELNRIKALLAQREKDLPAKDAEINSLREALRPSREKIEELTKKLNKASRKIMTNGGISLQPITVTAGKGKINGKVLEVNHGYGFLVVDVGTRAGVEKGDTLFVLRDNKLLGKIVVERTGYDVCVAKILYKALADAVKKGDLVCN